MKLYDRIIVNKDMFIRRAYIVANHVIDEKTVMKPAFEQLDLFTDYEEVKNRGRQRKKNVRMKRMSRKPFLI